MARNSAKDQETIELYQALMGEVMIRIDAINHASLGGTKLIGPLVIEFGYLQLRFMCELIALACLVAHGDIDATKASKFVRESTPGILLSMLEKLHPDFYPFPTRETKRDASGIELFLVKDGNFLTKAELVKLYGLCGDKLHKGNLKKLLSSKTPIQTNFPEIVRWAQKIQDLLAFHTIARLNGDPLLCIFKNPAHGNQLTVFLATPGSPPLPSANDH